ncbi:S-adenosyl-L-methionine-dependent methyltransferase [Gymnopus androsaceus JB14]|uniref:S-adenosyl-L-methionine-dependent methyltransferase n=1 Tax=Gymnopus androsaceus JB14 TaxID=1447944 RepID=A0A6A4H2F5_9AGAR|nr:S-adenosyl-L-methionine-dependent methyltransferase [Gymnopus androsaceus JB14]
MESPLTALANIISSGVHDLEAAYSKEGITLPATSLDDDPRLAYNKRLIVAAAAQIIASVRAPVDVLKESVGSVYTTATLGFVIDTKVADILKVAGRKGLHVNEISVITNVDASHLARVLRYLATRHIFREVSPDVFANNRVSSLLASTRSLKEIKADPDARFDDAPSAAHTSMYADEGLKSAVFFSKYLQNPEDSLPAFNMAFNTGATAWEWYGEHGNEWRGRRFAAAMKGNAKRFATEIISNGIDADSLFGGNLVVDVGGGVGSATLGLYKTYPHLQYIVQDIDAQIHAAKKYWEENAPDAVNTGSVKLQVHSFFNRQPIENARVYFLRIVTHDWPDVDVKKIMSCIRTAAGKSSKLVLFEVLARFTCKTSSDSSPYPLLGNLGIAGAGIDTVVDMHMLASYDGKERTETDFKNLGLETGWKLESVKPGVLAALVYSPV